MTSSMLDQSPTIIIQLTRMGDLIQSLPLINNLSSKSPTYLICDQQVEPWAKLLPGIEKIYPIDTRKWRLKGSGQFFEINTHLLELESEIDNIPVGSDSNIIPLNEHPICELLAASLSINSRHQYLTIPLILVRSCLHYLLKNRRQNRIHLSDLWHLALGNEENPTHSIEPSESGILFAQYVLKPLFERGSGQIWAIILGSGGKFRRLKPELLAAYWYGIPAKYRPGVVLVGGKGEEALSSRFIDCLGGVESGVVDLVGKCTPEQLIGVFSQVNLAIGVDTGPLHWAASTGTKVLGLYFGDAGFRETGPYGNGHYVLAPDCISYPCLPAVAIKCGYQCSQNFEDIKALISLWGSIAKGEMPQTPAGFSLFCSNLTNVGCAYQNVSGFRDEHLTIEINSNFKKVLLIRESDRVFGITDSDPVSPIKGVVNSGSESSDTSYVRRCFIDWENEIHDLPPAPGISNTVHAQRKRDAIARLNRISCEYSSSTITTSLQAS
jgi:ADP-heptose:LPS heptosyltransferase